MKVKYIMLSKEKSQTQKNTSCMFNIQSSRKENCQLIAAESSVGVSAAGREVNYLGKPQENALRLIQVFCSLTVMVSQGMYICRNLSKHAILWPLDGKNQLIGQDPDAGKD